MPKLKRTSVALCVRLAKIRKRRQRENLVKRQQERERDAQRHLRSRSHPEVNEERGRERAAEVFERIDPERIREQEHERNVSSRKQLPVDNRERRREKQVFIVIYNIATIDI